MNDYRDTPPRATSGRVAAVHAQIAIAAFLVVGQLWMLTAAWNELELGNVEIVATLGIASAVSFVLCLGTLLALRD